MITKAAAQYEDPSKNPAHVCSGCEHYSRGSCDKVQGTVAPGAWCKYYRAAKRTLKRMAGYEK